MVLHTNVTMRVAAQRIFKNHPLVVAFAFALRPDTVVAYRPLLAALDAPPSACCLARQHRFSPSRVTCDAQKLRRPETERAFVLRQPVLVRLRDDFTAAALFSSFSASASTSGAPSGLPLVSAGSGATSSPLAEAMAGSCFVRPRSQVGTVPVPDAR